MVVILQMHYFFLEEYLCTALINFSFHDTKFSTVYAIILVGKYSLEII